MKVKAIVFDLDDTLYNEIDYVYSGFRSVSSYFCSKYNISNRIFFAKMLKILECNGRGKVFDNVLKYFNIYNVKNVKKCISLYRAHKPNICLNTDVKKILNYYYAKNIPLYLVTDGNKIVQGKKIDALDIRKYIKKIFITHRYKKIHSKPSPYCFVKIANLEKIDKHHIVYIGDNINKDFVGIKPLGFRTIQILNGMFINAKKEEKFQAEIIINKINDLYKILKV